MVQERWGPRCSYNVVSHIYSIKPNCCQNNPAKSLLWLHLHQFQYLCWTPNWDCSACIISVSWLYSNHKCNHITWPIARRGFAGSSTQRHLSALTQLSTASSLNDSKCWWIKAPSGTTQVSSNHLGDWDETARNNGYLVATHCALIREFHDMSTGPVWLSYECRPDVLYTSNCLFVRTAKTALTENTWNNEHVDTVDHGVSKSVV